jgi:hypothetical protein
MDACEEAIEVHEGMIFGISHIPRIDLLGVAEKSLNDFYDSNLN